MLSILETGSVSSVPGFSAGAVYAGIKSQSNLDLAILCCNKLCSVASVFTTNQIKAAPVILSEKHTLNKKAQAIIVNSGCANACLAEQGLADASEMANLTAEKLSLNSEDILVASTGLIGAPLPMDKIRDGIKNITIDENGGHQLARAMMTTDMKPKEIAIEVNTGDSRYTIGGVTKGSGMIHPQMATMLCFITTDALVNEDFLQIALSKAIKSSFNMIDVDGDTSTNDCVFLLSSGTANNKIINSSNSDVFQNTLNEVCIQLAKLMVHDAEGVTKCIEVTVKGAVSVSDARKSSRAICSSSLVKTAAYGNDPNWGRILAAIGMAGALLEEAKLDIYIYDICVFKQGHPVAFDNENLRTLMTSKKDLQIFVNLNLGKEESTAWGSDLSEEYVRINSAYST